MNKFLIILIALSVEQIASLADSCNRKVYKEIANR
jgi:hypothetical protein